jgi:hypothetical protein
VSGVDVVVPCYNYARFLRECVTSVLAQEGVAVRVLVVDDCSSDDSPAVAARLAAEDPRVEFRRHEVNRGHINTYNEGLLGWAAAPYSLLLSADDALAPGALRRAVALLDAHPEAGMAYGSAICTLDPASERPPAGEGPHTAVLSTAEFVRLTCDVAGNVVPTPTAVVRTKLQLELGGYRHDLPHSGDMEMWLRFAAHGAVGVVDAVQGFYRVHATNMSVGYRGVRDLRGRKDALDSFFNAFAERVPEPESLRLLGRRRLAEAACGRASSMLNEGPRTPAVDECLAFAEEVYPAVRRQRQWLVAQLKKALGVRCARGLTALLNGCKRGVRRTGRGGDGSRDWLYSTWLPGTNVPAGNG